MERMDNDLAFMLKYENVAWYEETMEIGRASCRERV